MNSHTTNARARIEEDGSSTTMFAPTAVTVVGFFDASQPQPYDNSRHVWYVGDPHVERPLVKTDDSAIGFYALNGESLVKFTEDETKEQICEVLETIREQNPGKRILLVLDKHSSHICEYTRKHAHQLEIYFTTKFTSQKQSTGVLCEALKIDIQEASTSDHVTKREFWI